MAAIFSVTKITKNTNTITLGGFKRLGMFIGYLYMQNQRRIENWASKTIFLKVFKSKIAVKLI